MKTHLTIKESAKLIELDVDAKMASMVSWKQTEDWQRKSVLPNKEHLTMKPFRPMVMGFERFDCKDIFTLTDILSILPKEIEYNGLTYGLNMWVDKGIWYLEYVAEIRFNQWDTLTTDNFEYPELIDSLYQLLIWVIENGHYNPEK